MKGGKRGASGNERRERKKVRNTGKVDKSRKRKEKRNVKMIERKMKTKRRVLSNGLNHKLNHI